MAHYNTILNQITSFFPRHEFERITKIYHQGLKFYSIKHWRQCHANADHPNIRKKKFQGSMPYQAALHFLMSSHDEVAPDS